ncbi:MAG: 50S ribosomal protein L9 [Oscillospiraceae bacterium]|nr:50S ribosomal protein L9 [Oscillospiraceae bacterium]
MKVILQKDVRGQGKKGQLVEVSDGYARNYLLPRQLAVAATTDNINTMQLKEKAKREQEAKERAEAVALSKAMSEYVVKIPAKAGTGGRLFGAVTTKEISDQLKAQYGVDLPKSKMQADPIKSFGTYTVKCKLGYEVTAALKVMVTEE